MLTANYFKNISKHIQEIWKSSPVVDNGSPKNVRN